MEGKSLYEVLGTSKDASQADIKKAYRKLALQLHPDKNPTEEAKEQFQLVQKVYETLKDDEKRKVYDETGRWDGSEEGDLNAAYNFFWRNPITEDDIIQFETEYRGSETEKRELLELYAKCKGDMALVLESLVCSREEVDSHRFMDAIEAAIDAGEAKRFEVFTKWAEQIKQKPRPKDPLKPSKKRSKKKGGDGVAGLALAIKNKNKNNFASFLQNLEAKYADADADVQGVDAGEPTEEEFEAARQRMSARQGTQGGKAAGKKAAASTSSAGPARKKKKTP